MKIMLERCVGGSRDVFFVRCRTPDTSLVVKKKGRHDAARPIRCSCIKELGLPKLYLSLNKHPKVYTSMYVEYLIQKVTARTFELMLWVKIVETSFFLKRKMG